jgi:hypothetical protein
VALLEPFIPDTLTLSSLQSISPCPKQKHIALFELMIFLFLLFYPSIVPPSLLCASKISPSNLKTHTAQQTCPLLATQMAFSSSIAETPWKTRRKGPSEKDNLPSISLIMRERVTIRVLWAPVWNPFPWAFSFPLMRLFSVMEGILSCSNVSLDRSCYR